MHGSWTRPSVCLGPPDFIAAAALVALGSVIGARCAIKPKARDSWLIVPNLWGGIVGDPSAKKSPAWGAALQPLDRLIASALQDHRVTLADYETAKVVFDAQKDAIAGRIKEAARKPEKGDPAKIAKELRAHKEHAPDAPTQRRYKTNDSTVEKLGALLRENPAGLLVLRDELVGLVATWERGRTRRRARLLPRSLERQPELRHGPHRAGAYLDSQSLRVHFWRHPAGQVDGLSGTGSARSVERRDAPAVSGAGVPRSASLGWRDRSPNKSARDAAVAVFETLVDVDPVVRGAAPTDDLSKFPYFCFDDEAQKVFIEWSKDLHWERMGNEDEPIISGSSPDLCVKAEEAPRLRLGCLGDLLFLEE